MTTTTVAPEVLWLRTLAWNQAAHPTTTTFVVIGQAASVSTAGSGGCAPPGSTSTPTILTCIKACESGNYAEASHPNDGSGAFQYTPGTWRAWFARWAASSGYTGPAYDLAYQAPADVQDAVTAYTVENGGAHNWDPAYGYDPCTVGLP